MSDRLVVVVKPTSRCNAACRYCSAHKDEHGPDMPVERVHSIHARLAEYGQTAGKRSITLLWHGGEPLLMGKEFYREAWSIGAAFDRPSFGHQLQSNLLLLDPEWVALLREFDVHVGTSVDPLGTDRILGDGRLQLPIWVRSFKLASDAGLRPGIVFVVTPVHVGRAMEVYAFFRNLQHVASEPVNVRLNPVYPAGAAARLGDAGELSSEAYGLFLCQVEERWQRDGRPFPIAPFVDWSGNAPQTCDFAEDCTDLVVGIDAGGDVYKCGRYMETGTSWGNIEESPLEAVLAGPVREQVSRRSRLLRAGPCRDCAHWAVCHGGCPYQAELVHGTPLRKTPFCTAYTAYLDTRPTMARRM